ncbi:helix-turn-helix domain-containing protein [Pseudonocardiaceae bacterium YIM PH 21723]|nr:helix-turn-helix domain-containing protein [Pseudonocardiaceae bacterium YIM PH 21723]
MVEHPAEPLASTLAEKVDQQLRQKYADVAMPGNRKVAADIERQTGRRLSGAYIAQLRNGTQTNPTSHTLQILADFFGVHPGYFAAVTPAPGDGSYGAAREAIVDGTVQAINARLMDASVETRRAALAAVEFVLQHDERHRQGEQRRP